MFRDTKIPLSYCPYCHGKLDGAASLEGRVPSPGDISVCIYCKETLVFNSKLKMRKPRMGELTPQDMLSVDKMLEQLERGRK